MRKKILPLGLLLAGISLNAQVAFVGDQANFNVKPETLVYSGGTLKVVNNGVVTNEGNVKIDNGDFLTAKSDGSNFVIKLNDKTSYKSYGQLWINNNDQSKITGYVKKEFKDKDHGQYQQIALPFYNKQIETLSNELGGSKFTDVRFIGKKASGENVLKWDNLNIKQDLIKLAEYTSDPTAYYFLGTKNLGVSYFSNNESHIKGIPYKSGISVSLENAGSGIDFGVDGNALNIYGQKYKNYFYDSWEASSGEWVNNFGKNIYQFGNPYLTNIDLTKINFKEFIKGIRFEVSGTSTNFINSATSSAKYINFTTGATIPVGDLDKAIIKPMQTFVIKMADNNSKVLNFDNLRTFDNISSSESFEVSSFSKSRNKLNVNSKSYQKSNGSVKQLEVIALDENYSEIDRTYYVVYPDAQSGSTIDLTKKSVQVTADNSNEIGTFEESIDGGIDKSLEDTYWLYINEANENDFKGKQIPLIVYSDKIKFLKFNIRENTKLFPEHVSQDSSGVSFYFLSNSKQTSTVISQGLVVDLPNDIYGKSNLLSLTYGKPNESVLSTGDYAKPKLSETILVFDKSDSNYKLIFDKNWKKSTVKIYNLSGSLQFVKYDVDTSTPFILTLPSNLTNTYIVEATSDQGVKFVKKIIK